MKKIIFIVIASLLNIVSLQAQIVFEPANEGSIRVQNISRKYDIAVGFGDMGSYTILDSETGGAAEFAITQDQHNKENEYITINLKVYDPLSAGDKKRKVLERKSVRLFAPLGTFGQLNRSENQLHLDYDKHSKNGTNAGKFKIKFKPDSFNKKITKVEQLLSSYI